MHHGCDGISMAILKLCAKEIAVPSSIIFQQCIRNGKFPDSWKLPNVRLIHKKKSPDKNELDETRAVSFLDISRPSFLQKSSFVENFLTLKRVRNQSINKTVYVAVATSCIQFFTMFSHCTLS